MDFYKDTDKKKFDFSTDEFEITLANPAEDLKGFRIEEGFIFGRFSKEDIWEMLSEAQVISKLQERGYFNFHLETQCLSHLDNRIFIKTSKNEVLIHMRLKLDDFEIKRVGQVLKMIYVDWLLTQNIRLGKRKIRKKLFEGQDYPGLNIFREIKKFILLLTRKMGVHGIFNVPEYFHDAVLFHKSLKFLYLDPEKEGLFQTLLESFKKISLHKLSELIHNNRIYNMASNKTFSWFHGEMFYTEFEEIKHALFNSEYFKILEETKKKHKFKVLGTTHDISYL